jgi:hypothetical protein
MRKFLSMNLQYCDTRKKVKEKCTVVHALKLCTSRTAHRGSRDIALLFHDHGTRRGESSASRPGRTLPPGKTHCTIGCVGPRARLDRCGKSRPPPGFNRRTVQSVASRYTDYTAIPGPNFMGVPY